jgi:monofunctional biosynthetic peptidoglycan transglycosylase
MSGAAQPPASSAPPQADALPASPARQKEGRGVRWWVRRVMTLLALLVVAWHAWIFAQVWWLRGHNPSTTAFMRQGLERLQGKNPKAQLKHRWVDYDRISIHLKRAVIAAEDQKFLEHDGFDWEALQEAYERNVKRRRVVRGGSTISQQVAKNMFLTGRKTYLRKAEEAVITVMIELLLDKRRILEIYLNVIEWGNGVYGAEAASLHYYNISAAQVDREQSARLAAMIPNPRFYDRNRSTPGLERRAEILQRYYDVIPVP